MHSIGSLSGFYRIAEWIMRLAYVNMLWILFTIMGLIIFGFFPATAASLTVIRKWFMGDTDIPVFKTFYDNFKEEFIKVNILGFILLVLTYILYLDFDLINKIDGTFRMIMYIALIMFSLLLFITMVYLFPVYVHYRLKLFTYFKHALMIGIISPLSTIMMVIGFILLYQVFIHFPGLIPFFGVSLIFTVIMGPAYMSFKKIEQRKNKLEGNE